MPPHAIRLHRHVLRCVIVSSNVLATVSMVIAHVPVRRTMMRSAGTLHSCNKRKALHTTGAYSPSFSSWLKTGRKARRPATSNHHLLLLVVVGVVAIQCVMVKSLGWVSTTRNVFIHIVQQDRFLCSLVVVVDWIAPRLVYDCSGGGGGGFTCSIA
jgi:hypothetical protein